MVTTLSPDPLRMRRLSLMHTCGRWYAAIASGPPHLVPAAVLACPPLKTLEFVLEDYEEDEARALSLVSHAAQLPPQTWHVRLEGIRQVRYT